MISANPSSTGIKKSSPVNIDPYVFMAGACAGGIGVAAAVLMIIFLL